MMQNEYFGDWTTFKSIASDEELSTIGSFSILVTRYMEVLTFIPKLFEANIMVKSQDMPILLKICQSGYEMRQAKKQWTHRSINQEIDRFLTTRSPHVPKIIVDQSIGHTLIDRLRACEKYGNSSFQISS